MIKLKAYSFSGTPEQIGHAHGEELRDSIQRFVQIRLDAAVQYFKAAGINKTGLVDQLLQTGKACYNIFAKWDPEGLAEHNAIAKAAGVKPEHLYTSTNYTDIRDAYMLAGSTPDAEGCSALMIPASHSKHRRVLAGQTWDLNPEDIDYVVAIKANPIKGPARWSIQLSGCLSLMGMNSEGLAVGTTNLKTWHSTLGVGYLNLIHRAMRCDHIDDAASMLADAPKSGAHSFFLANALKGLRFEVSGFNYDQQSMTTEPMGWTNHCLSPEHQAAEYEQPTPSSLARFNRLKQLLNTKSIDVESIKAMFSNRDDGINSINRYPEDNGYAATNACMIADPKEQILYACCGPADRGEWLTLTFDK
ncbi:MAG: C45 family autoproteolytic acyltransferase/hydrolase [Endozoicomonas sp. (ex Botrylloides leachii)]|nr:C45 family autoproteolytic acyltransferase/hydrolase [Endozoicomonas sp. (ex Botrylloides leachii)]